MANLVIVDTPISAVEIGDNRARSVSDARVNGLIMLIETLGFTTPIEVRKAPKGRVILVDGAHRLEAMRRLGHDVIPAITSDISAREARGREIGANLGGGMTPLQGAIFLAGWQDFYEEKYPETRRGVAGALAKHGLQPANLRFAEVAAENWGVSPSQIEKAVSAARRLTRDEKRALDRPAKPVSMDAIMKIGKIADPDERSAVVGMIAEGKAAKVAAARQQYAVAHGHAQPLAKDPVETAFKGLLAAWTRSSMASRRRFVAEVFAELSPIVVDEAEKRDAADIAALRRDEGADE